MDITMHYQEAPTIPDEIQQELLEMTPKTFMIWNPTWRETEVPGAQGKPIYEPRWEIWCELRDVSHPEAKNQLADSDRWNTEHQCWMRKLQTYETADGEFAPVDRGLIIGLRLADTWARDNFYEEFVDEPFFARERALQDRVDDASAYASRYYANLDNPSVGPYVSKGWRHRIR